MSCLENMTKLWCEVIIMGTRYKKGKVTWITQCYRWGGVIGQRPIQKKNGLLTSEIAILNLEKAAHWNFNFIGITWKMANNMICPSLSMHRPYILPLSTNTPISHPHPPIISHISTHIPNTWIFHTNWVEHLNIRFRFNLFEVCIFYKTVCFCSLVAIPPLHPPLHNLCSRCIYWIKCLLMPAERMTISSSDWGHQFLIKTSLFYLEYTLFLDVSWFNITSTFYDY